MGIVNTTPDSFFPESRKTTTDAVLFRVEQMIREGATFIDIGGQSTRPGSARVPADEELARVLPALEAVARRFPDLLISIDTFYAKVAQRAVESGVSIINDVSAGTLDPELLPVAAGLKVPYVLMHMKGDPQTMQVNPVYGNVVEEVFDFFSFRIAALEAAGIYDIILDPGFGFGKTATHNFTLLKHLHLFDPFRKPLLIGLSRKATVYKTLQVPVEEALNGTTVLNTISLLNGAAILRVHDVKEAVQAVRLFNAYNQ